MNIQSNAIRVLGFMVFSLGVFNIGTLKATESECPVCGQTLP